VHCVALCARALRSDQDACGEEEDANNEENEVEAYESACSSGVECVRETKQRLQVGFVRGLRP